MFEKLKFLMIVFEGLLSWALRTACQRSEDISRSSNFEIGSLQNLKTMPRELKKCDNSSFNVTIRG